MDDTSQKPGKDTEPEAEAVEANAPEPERDAPPELTPRQKRIEARAKRRKEAAERAAQEAKEAEAQAKAAPAAQEAERTAETEPKDTPPEEPVQDAPEKTLSEQIDETTPRRRKRRDVLSAARRQVERIKKKNTDEQAFDPAVQPGEPGLPANAAQSDGLVQQMKRKNELAPNERAQMPMNAQQRELEIADIQRELVQRRQRRWTMMWLRLAFFIVLPTFLIGNYFYNHASPFYSTESAFIIERSSAPSAIGGAGLFSGTSLVTARESISVQEFLISREAMRVLDQDLDILDHFADPNIDRIQRLEPGASENDAYSIYKDRVLVGFDTTEGIIRLETIAASPEMAQNMANRLIALAEERISSMSSRNLNDAVSATQDAVDDANAMVDQQYARVLDLQQRLGIFNADMEVQMVLTMIGTLTGQLEERRLRLAALQDNARPNAAQVRVLEVEIGRLEDAIEERRDLILRSADDQTSLAIVSVELQRAQADLALAQGARVLALEGNSIARREADQQTLYLAPVVNPVLPDVPNYPRAFQYTVLSFIIFFAIYMLASLTVSILREQMSYGTHS